MCLIDLFASFSEYFGEDLPESAAEDSISFWKTLLGEKTENGREQIVHHSGDGMFSFRKGYWKMIEGRGSGGFTRTRSLKQIFKNFLKMNPEGQLYNLKNDLQEKNNLWEKKPEKVQEMLTVLRKIQNSDKSRDL